MIDCSGEMRRRKELTQHKVDIGECLLYVHAANNPKPAPIAEVVDKFLFTENLPEKIFLDI